ncbi:hypothetical protein LSCM1_06358 [Leishmania martiniquensis]|uniref:Wd40 repeat domain-containing protein n=1 Tax=Leishmania martiniquensis TaxID=1580590 RepID=A0A836H9A3_9TRYP|nr:hypothetical protein LSCM1_06358 [Leishmania martiniquensis]
MHLGSLQCTQKGRVRLPLGNRGGAVYTDDFGGVWVTADDARKVLYYAPHTLATSIEQQQQMSLPVSSNSASCVPLSSSCMPYTVAFHCDAGDAPQADRVHSLLFFSRHACDSGSPKCDLCIVTAHGTLAFVRVPVSDHEEPPPATVAQPHQEVRLGMRVCAATVTCGATGHFVLCCQDGAFTEVIRVTVISPAEQLGSAGSAAAEGDYEVDATGLFRVEGRIEVVLHDPVQDVLVTVSGAGYVDVWDMPSAEDVTMMYGSLSWDCDRYGSPTCALLCHGRLWVGLTSGQLLVFPFSDRARAAPSPSSQGVQLLRSHTSRVTGLLRMSLGTDVWSCAIDSAKVNVWDAASAAFRGSFVFPDVGLLAWEAGAAHLRTALWGIDGVTGEPSLMQVTQALPDPNGAQVLTREETRAQHRAGALLHAYQVCWRSMLRMLRQLLFGDAEDTDADAGKVMLAALELVGQDAHDGGDNSDVLRAIRAIHEPLRRLRDAHRRDDPESGIETMDLPSLMESCATWHEAQSRALIEVDALLRTLNASTSETSRLTSLEDVGEEIVMLRARVDELESELARIGDRCDHDAVPRGGEESSVDVVDKDFQSAQDALSSELERNRELEAQLSEAQSELRSLASQHAHTQQLLEASNEHVEQLKRSLQAAKRAAEVKLSDVSSFFEMESMLHESQGVIADLSAKVETLLKEADVTTASLHAFQERQEAAKKVLQRVLCTQNDLADDVCSLVDEVSVAIAEFKKRQHAALAEHASAFVGVVEGEMCRLEMSIEERLHEQQRWLRSLSLGWKGIEA